MPNAGAPSGPGKPKSRGRDAAAEREEIDEALTDADLRVKRTGETSTRAQPSPQADNEALPGEETRSGERKGQG